MNDDFPLHKAVSEEINKDDIDYVHIYDIAFLTPNITGLPTGIYISNWDGKEYNNKNVYINISNTSGPFNDDSYFTIKVDKSLFITTPNTVNFTKKQITLVKNWIKLNYDVIQEFHYVSENGGKYIPLYNKIKRIVIQENLFEMAKIDTNITKLSIDIWIGKVGEQHGPRIKVSNTKGNFNPNDCFSISIEKEPEIKTPIKNVKIPNSDIKSICDWIKLNYY